MARTSASWLAKTSLSEGLGVAAACMIMPHVCVCSIGRLAFFGPCDIQVEPGVQPFKSNLDTAVRRLTFF